MTTLAKLLTRRRQLVERPEQGPGSHERDEIERMLAEIDEVLDRLEGPRPGASKRDER